MPEGGRISREEFGEQRRALHARILGYVRFRLANRDDAEDVAQEAWLSAYERLEIYDPSRAPVEAFVKYWASVHLLRFYDGRDQRREAEVLFTDLAARFPGLEAEPELAEVMDRLRRREVEDQLAPDPAAVIVAAAAAPLGLRLLEVVFGGVSPPHQLIAFGFAKFGYDGAGAGGTDSAAAPARKRRGPLDPTRAKAARLVTEGSDRPLRAMEAEMEALLSEELDYGRADVERALERLRGAMDLALGDAVSDVRTRKAYRKLLAAIVGETALRQYYTGDPEGCVSEWLYSVKRRTWGDVARDRELAVTLREFFDSLAGKVMRRRKGTGGHDDGA